MEKKGFRGLAWADLCLVTVCDGWRGPWGGCGRGVGRLAPSAAVAGCQRGWSDSPGSGCSPPMGACG